VKGPAPRLPEWRSLSDDDRALVVVIALVGVVIGLVVMRYTFGPALWRWLFS